MCRTSSSLKVCGRTRFGAARCVRRRTRNQELAAAVPDARAINLARSTPGWRKPGVAGYRAGPGSPAGRSQHRARTSSDSYRQRFEEQLTSSRVSFRSSGDSRRPTPAPGLCDPGERLDPQPADGGSGVRYALKFRVLVSIRGSGSRPRSTRCRVFAAHRRCAPRISDRACSRSRFRPASTAIACRSGASMASRAICSPDRLHVGRLDTRAFA